MSELELLNADQRDALQEVTNIAMGQAGASLANILGTFVNLSVPRISIQEVGSIGQAISALVGDEKLITVVRQSFYGSLKGEAFVIYDQAGCKDLGELLGYEEELDGTAEREVLLDVGNVLVGACLGGVAELLQANLSYSAPSVMAEQVPVNRLIDPSKMSWKYALLVEINFTLQQHEFMSHVTFLMPEASVVSMGEALDRFMESF